MFTYFILYFSIFNTTGISHLKIRLPTLQLPSLTSKPLTVTMRVVFDLNTVFHAQFVDRSVIYLPNKFLKRYCIVALIICSTKLVAKNLSSRPLRGSTLCGDITLKISILFQDLWPYEYITSGPWDQCCSFLTVLHFNNIDNTYCRKLQDTRSQAFVFSFLY
jgi:hypothetical protein